MSEKILLIDDDKDLSVIIKRYMEKEGYCLDTSYTASSGILNAEKQDYSLIILDVMLPEMDGFTVLNEIRITSSVPVLMLTAKDEITDKVHYLRNGADDYMTKPFNPEELMARVESLTRRYADLRGKKIHEKPIQVDELTLNPKTREVKLKDEAVELTGKEFDLLYFLALHKGAVFTKKQIYNQVWNQEYAFDDSNIMSFISKLRKKIETDPDRPKYIHTIRGVGYRFNGGL